MMTQIINSLYNLTFIAFHKLQPNYNEPYQLKGWVHKLTYCEILDEFIVNTVKKVTPEFDIKIVFLSGEKKIYNRRTWREIGSEILKTRPIKKLDFRLPKS